ncbi:MAG TPA: hypothetical protein VEZ11_04490 [Thermoanaerobaculia bacterium]|nr:hypothetical protein [Thermoanaerobaculia bacterium]
MPYAVADSHPRIVPRSLAPMELLRGGLVKGNVLKAHLQWLYVAGGHAGRERLLLGLDPDSAAEGGGAVLASSWYRFATLIAVDRAIITGPGGGDDRFAEELGAFAARLELASSGYLRTARGIHDFLRHSALLHRQHIDFGSASYEQTGQASGRMIHRHYRCFSPILCMNWIGYYRQSLQVRGADAVLIDETHCHCHGDETCTFEMNWR